ncbi:MAG: undecaprenyldiphospho-muramoylpentapeptide beta-N-acetylglucosaminyltransferase [Erysipelotrichaceae bacterium]
MKCLIATGGTGGHIYPALSLAHIIKNEQPDSAVVFVGNADRMEATLIPEKGYPFYGLQAKGLAGSPIDKLKALLLVPKAFFDARSIINKEEIEIVVGFGGYVSTPVLLAAKSKGCKTIIHEQNSIFGKANRAVAKTVDAIVTCYDDVATSYGEKVMKLGNPRASEAVLDVYDPSLLNDLALDAGKKTILIVMGSLGSSSVNALMKDALSQLSLDYNCILVSGKAYEETTRAAFAKTAVHVVPYVNQGAIIDGIDLLICRAGATTAAEICAKGTPAILIPSPYVANNHQYYNAMALYEQGACELIEEKDLNQARLFEVASNILEDENLRNQIKQRASALGTRNAAYDLLALMQRLVRG